MKLIYFLLSTSLATATLGAHAQLVSNGGFETGDLSGWSVLPQPVTAGDPPSVDPQQVQVTQANPALGLYSLMLTGADVDAWGHYLYYPVTLSQTLNTVAGQTYVLSYSVDPTSILSGQSVTLGAPGFSGCVEYDGGDPSLLNPLPLNQYTSVSQQFVASSSSTTLYVSAIGAPAYFDNISVTEAVSAVPEPQVWALLLLSVSGGVLARSISSRRPKSLELAPIDPNRCKHR